MLVIWLTIACGTPSATLAADAPAAAPAVAAPPPPPAPRAPPPRRVVAVGDLHGDPDATRAVLRLAGVTDDAGAWIGGDTVLVQTGDVTDRGPDSAGVMRILRDLAAAAPAQGGRVIALLGNHESMNVRGDWRYVAPEELAAYGGAEPRAAAYARDGEWGKYIASLDAVAIVGDTVFCHGGITPAFADRGVARLNTEVRGALFAAAKAPVIDETGPLWYRGYVQDDETTACPALERALAALDVSRMVVGHTTQRDGRVQSRCGGRLTVIDTGISAHYGGHVAAWESLAGDARAVYPSGPVDLPDPR